MVLHPCRFHALGFFGYIQHFTPKLLGIFRGVKRLTPMWISYTGLFQAFAAFYTQAAGYFQEFKSLTPM